MTTTTHEKCSQQYYTNRPDSRGDLSILNPTTSCLDNNEMESMLADLSPTSFSSISDDTADSYGLAKLRCANTQTDAMVYNRQQHYNEFIKS